MTKMLRIAVTALALGTLVSPSWAEDKDPVVAKVNGQEIRYSEVASSGAMGMMGAAPIMRLQASQTMPPGMYQQFLDQTITTKLLAKEGYDEKLQNNKDVKEKLRASEEQILAAAYLDYEVGQKVTDDKIKERYKATVAKYVPEELIKLSVILVPTEDEAKDIIKQLKKGADFAKLAAEKSKDPTSTRGGDYGVMSSRGLMPQFAEGIKGLKSGDISETPYKSGPGYYVFKLVDQRKSSPPTFEQVKDQTAEQLRQEIAVDIRQGIMTKAKIERFNSDGSPIVSPQASPAPVVPMPPAAKK